jgi:hypothetical protein
MVEAVVAPFTPAFLSSSSDAVLSSARRMAECLAEPLSCYETMRNQNAKESQIEEKVSYVADVKKIWRNGGFSALATAELNLELKRGDMRASHARKRPQNTDTGKRHGSQ